MECTADMLDVTNEHDNSRRLEKVLMVHTLNIYCYHSSNALEISDLPAFNTYIMVMVTPGMSHANICSRNHDQE